MDKITFCIPSKNNRRYLEACIPSIRRNSFRDDHDIIVFVDADNDGTVVWLESIREKYNIKDVVLSGGVAQNIKALQVLKKNHKINSVWAGPILVMVL